MDGIEVWNSAWSPANERAVELWHTLLVGGNRKFAVASTDFHRGGNIASPHTVVRAEALSAEAVIDAIAAGRSYVARDTSAEIGMQVRNSRRPYSMPTSATPCSAAAGCRPSSGATPPAGCG